MTGTWSWEVGTIYMIILCSLHAAFLVLGGINVRRFYEMQLNQFLKQ